MKEVLDRLKDELSKYEDKVKITYGKETSFVKYKDKWVDALIKIVDNGDVILRTDILEVEDLNIGDICSLKYSLMDVSDIYSIVKSVTYNYTNSPEDF